MVATEQGIAQRFRFVWSLAVVLGASLAAFLIFVSVASAATITVNSLDDNAVDDGECTLREAITAANDNEASGVAANECLAGEDFPIVDGIAFSPGGTGTISPATLLPTITEVVDIDGSTAPGEVKIDGGGSTLAGLTVTADDSIIEGLTITSTTGRGVDLNDSSGVTVRDNLIGTDAADSTGLGHGIGVNASSNVTDAVIEDNVIADAGFGVALRTATVSDIVVIGNRIGTDSTGTTAIPNDIGIQVTQGAKNVRVGGLAAGDRNLISGNTVQAIDMSATVSRSTGNQVLGNRVGTTVNGESALPNSGASGTSGFAIIVGGGIDGAEFRGNLISGNAGGGIKIEDRAAQALGQAGPTGNVIAGNRLGVDKDGNTLLSNGSFPIQIVAQSGHAASGNAVGGVLGLTQGGACTGDCNVIASDLSSSVVISGTDTANTSVLGNHIGVDSSGTAATDSGASGVSVVQGTGATIGSPAAPNVISAATDGVVVQSASATVIQSNLLGTGSNGSGDFGPTTSGVFLNGATGVLLGGSGAGEGNTIAHSGVRGVFIPGGDENALLGNEIFDSGALGIDLSPLGVTPNDEGVQDVDSGANGLQNFPELEAAVIGGSTHIVGSLDSSADTDFRIEFFSNAVPDGLGHGEGEFFLGATTVKTDAAGLVEFVATVPVDAVAGASISATATELDGSGNPLSTSEFAANIVEGTASCDPSATAGDDLLCGTSGADTIDGLGGDDVILGLGGADVLGGSAGNDLLLGDGGADVLTGGAGLDELRGGNDGDTLQTDDGGEADKALCGAGTDTANGDTADTFVDCETVSDGTTPLTTPTPPDTAAPQLTLSGDKKQSSKKRVVVKAVCEDESCDLTATGTIKIKILKSNGKVKETKKFDLKEATKDGAAVGETNKLKVKLTSKATKKLKKVIKKKTSKATIKVTATDAAGNSTGAVKFKVKVKK